MNLTAKQVFLLGSMAVKPVIAPWSSPDLVKLERVGLVSGQIAFGANCRVHTSKVWTLTDGGRLVLQGQKA